MRKIPSYETYVKAYYDKQQQLAKKGYSMYDTLFSVEEYQANYQALRNTQLEQKTAGKRKTVKNVLRDLVNDQAYAVTRQQALHLRKAGKQFGLNLKLAEIMSDPSQLNQILKEQRELLKQEGYSSKEISLIISQEYFGSP